MRNWEQKNILEASGKVIFFNEIGYGVLPPINEFSLRFIVNDKIYNSQDIYISVNDSYVKVDCVLKNLNDYLFDRTLYVYKSYINNVFEPITLQEIQIGVDIPVLKDYSDIKTKSADWQKIHVKKSFCSKEQLNDFQVWVSDLDIKKCFKIPYNNVKVGEEYYYIGVGVCKVIQAYDFPTKDSVICDIESVGGKTIKVKYGDNNLVSMPSKFDVMVTADALAIFNEQLNENILMPYVEVKDSGCVIFWKEVSDATSYFVEVFRIIKGKLGKRLYHLLDYTAEKGKYYLSVSAQDMEIWGVPIVFRVTAKDKDGNVVAFGRGMEKGYPKFFY